ncbi:MAG: hypothetical protein LBE17_01480 [Treponema sp.]|nr:hypothetical protein [Treponema sp.]
MFDQKGSIPDQECSILDQERSIPDQECSILDQECSILDQECSILDQECSILDQECSVFDQEYRDAELKSRVLEQAPLPVISAVSLPRSAGVCPGLWRREGFPPRRRPAGEQGEARRVRAPAPRGGISSASLFLPHKSDIFLM